MDDQSKPWWQTTEMQGGRALILSSLAFSLMTVCVKQLNSRLPHVLKLNAVAIKELQVRGV